MEDDLLIKKVINISKQKIFTLVFSNNKKGYQLKISEVMTREQLIAFLNLALYCDYLMIEVAMVIVQRLQKR